MKQISGLLIKFGYETPRHNDTGSHGVYSVFLRASLPPWLKKLTKFVICLSTETSHTGSISANEAPPNLPEGEALEN
jgi:hypothetical protein